MKRLNKTLIIIILSVLSLFINNNNNNNNKRLGEPGFNLIDLGQYVHGGRGNKYSESRCVNVS